MEIMDVDKGIIYYTDNQIEQPIKSLVWNLLQQSGLPITASYLQPGEQRGYPQMVRQIISCLERSEAKYVYFCEHDVLYAKSYFDFIPSRDDAYYYNTNLYRWDYPNDRLITYDGLTSLSQMSCNRLLALNHFQKRLQKIEEQQLEKLPGREPEWARIWGYEPGTKRTRLGGFSNEQSVKWKAVLPNIDIRHRGTYSPSKVELRNFKHQPQGWQEKTLIEAQGWDLKGLFNL